MCVRVLALLGCVRWAGLSVAFWCISPFLRLLLLPAVFAWPPPGGELALPLCGFLVRFVFSWAPSSFACVHLLLPGSCAPVCCVSFLVLVPCFSFVFGFFWRPPLCVSVFVFFAFFLSPLLPPPVFFFFAFFFFKAGFFTWASLSFSNPLVPAAHGVACPPVLLLCCVCAFIGALGCAACVLLGDILLCCTRCVLCLLAVRCCVLCGVVRLWSPPHSPPGVLFLLFRGLLCPLVLFCPVCVCCYARLLLGFVLLLRLCVLLCLIVVRCHAPWCRALLCCAVLCAGGTSPPVVVLGVLWCAVSCCVAACVLSCPVLPVCVLFGVICRATFFYAADISSCCFLGACCVVITLCRGVGPLCCFVLVPPGSAAPPVAVAVFCFAWCFVVLCRSL